MRNRYFKLQLLVALPVVAMLALPGEAKPVLPQSVSALAPIVEAVPAQALFGMLLDPHANPVLTIELPTAFSATL